MGKDISCERCVLCILWNEFVDTLNKHAPFKKKLIRANHAPMQRNSSEKRFWEGQIYKRFILKKDTWIIKKIQERRELL